jgi:hypothetical protein
VRNEEFALDMYEGANPVAPPLCDDLNRARDSDAPRVGVRRECEHSAAGGERLKHGVGFSLLFRVSAPNWMHEEHKIRRTNLCMLVRRHGLDQLESIDRRRPDQMNPSRLFAKPRDARCTLSARGKVDVRELRDCMSHRLIGDAFRTIAAVNVRDADSTDRCRARSGKRLDAIAEYDHDVGREPLKKCGERGNTTAKRGSVGKSARLARSLHLETVHSMATRLDPDDRWLEEKVCGVTKGRIAMPRWRVRWLKKVRTASADLERKITPRDDLMAYRRKQPPLCARARHDHDAPRSAHAHNSLSAATGQSTSASAST